MMTVPQAFHLALQHQQAGRLAEAEALYRQILGVQPNSAETCNNLANIFARLGHFENAIAFYRRAVAIKPDYAEAFNNLGVALKETGQWEEAVAAYEHAQRLRPDLADVEYNLGNGLCDLGRLDDALAAYQRVLHPDSGHADAWNGLAHVFNRQGRIAEAISALRAALRLQPTHAGAHSNLIYTFHFDSGQDERSIAAEQERWNRQFVVSAPIAPYNNTRDPERRLRIGYVSADFREHVIGNNVWPLFTEHDRQAFEILCYSGVGQPDRKTEEFRQRADRWRNAPGWSDEALAAAIRDDGVDILVDLTQHLAGNRLPMFTRCPAPVQVSFAGYPESTGVKGIKYRISDRWLEQGKVRADDRLESVFLVESFWCYNPLELDIEVNELPARTNGLVTFGSLNNFSKINGPLLDLWARVMNQVKESRLVLLSGFGSHRQRSVELLGRKGIALHRIEFVEPRPRKEYLETYHRLDVVLDTFPYNGHTTSLDALWMGVPVVSLAGDRPVSRAGLSQLSNLGLPELVAQTEDEYVEIAVRLAADLPRLVELRRTLRARMEASVLLDARHYAHNIEAAYRAMWRQWCKEGSTP